MATIPCVLLLGTCDTKLQELLFTRQRIEETGDAIKVILIDVGGTPSKDPAIDISSFEVRSRFMDQNQEPLDVSMLSRGEVINQMIKAGIPLVRELYTSHSIHGAIALGGSGGTSLATSIMRESLPVGFPKLVVSTVASGDTSSYLGESDIMLLPSIVDVAGLNSVLKMILGNAAVAIAGMTRLNFERGLRHTRRSSERKRIAITMFGVTTPAATVAMQHLSGAGHEVFTFHATGTGGRAMERLILEGQIDGVLDLTTTELADEFVGGIMSAGSDRLKAAGQKSLPQIVSLGALDMVNFGPLASVPEKFRNRQLYEHNPSITLMRTTPEECRRLGEVIAERLRETCKNHAEVEVWIPMRGVSMISGKEGAFYDQDADKALAEALKQGLDGTEIVVKECDYEINDPQFALGMAKRLLEMMGE